MLLVLFYQKMTPPVINDCKVCLELRQISGDGPLHDHPAWRGCNFILVLCTVLKLYVLLSLIDNKASGRACGSDCPRWHLFTFFVRAGPQCFEKLQHFLHLSYCVAMICDPAFQNESDGY